MAKYTTEVRSICESKAGLRESKGANNVDSIIADSWDKIFTTQCTFFDETYRQVLCKKILKHYYRREIGAETAGLWILWMNTRLEEIMPYYNQLYSSELIQFNPMHNMDMTKSRTIVGTETGAETGTESSTDTRNLTRVIDSTDGGSRSESDNTIANSSGSGSESSSSERDISRQRDRDVTEGNGKTDAYSDTPQGSLSNVEQNAYLTNYRKIGETNASYENDEEVTSDDVDNTGSNSYTETGSESNAKSITYGKTNNLTTNEVDGKTGSKNIGKNTQMNSTENYIESVVGNNGSWNFSRLLQDFRDTFLNIDMMVINEFKDLFLNLW